MISLQTGTNVPRFASSLNSSNVVSFMTVTEPAPAWRANARDARPRRLRMTPAAARAAGPELELRCRLRHEHVESAERLAPGAAGLAQQARFLRVVDQVVDEAPVEHGHRATASRRPRGCHAGRRGVDQQIPAAGGGRHRGEPTPESLATSRAASVRARAST